MAETERWIVLKNVNNNVLSLDSQSITTNKYKRPGNTGNTITCWIKIDVASQEIREEFQQKANMDNSMRNINFANLSYFLWKWHFDIDSDEVTEQTVIYYNNKGEEIARENINPNWRPIEPESMEELVYNAVKKQLGIK